MAIIATVLNVVAGILTIVMAIVYTAAFVTAVDESTKESTVAESPAAEAEEPAAAPAAEVQELAVGETAFGIDAETGWGWFAVEIENPNPDHIFNDGFTVEAYDAAGVLVDSDSSYITVMSGRTMIVGNFMQLGTAAIDHIEVRGPMAAGATSSPAGETGSMTVGNITTAMEYDWMTVTGQVTSTFAEDQEMVRIDLVARNENGVIIGVDFTYLDRLPAGGTAQFEVGYWKVPAGSVIEAYPHV
ncbi:hypothetical protein ACDF64_07730 [Agromyces sp. MMS24-JH15]|uniref:hypothetical protein n=1 Tax=Agromyces sp. MMS24-JH15 TaxID=3243765 RepID=UPI003749997C